MEARKAALRRRHASPASPAALLVCGLLFVLVVVEFWVMHHHAPVHQRGVAHHHYDSLSQVPVRTSVEDGDSHNSPALPGEPSLPDSMRETAAVERSSSSSAPAHTRTPRVADQPNLSGKAPETKNSGGDIADLGLPPRPSEGQGASLGGESKEPFSEDEGYGDMRVAVLVPYSGPGLPLWFDAFTDLAAASKDLVDWIIFCDEACII